MPFPSIGRGATSSVVRAKRKDTGEDCAIKQFNLQELPEDFEERVLKEIATLALLDHPNIIKLYASFFRGDEQLWMVMPLISGGSVLDIMQEAFPTGFSEELAGAILHGVLMAIQYLHSKQSLHRDLKAGNIFVASDGTVILGDFGVAADLIERGNAATGRRTFAGTPCWMAPEVMERRASYSIYADIWSFGITAIELVKGKAPHADHQHPMKIVMKVLSSPPPSLDEGKDKKTYSSKFRAMVRKCCQKDPKKRPTADQLVKDPFFKKVQGPSFIQSEMLSKVPPVWERNIARLAKDAQDGAGKKDGGHKERISNKFARFKDAAQQVDKETSSVKPKKNPGKFGSLMDEVDASTKIK